MVTNFWPKLVKCPKMRQKWKIIYRILLQFQDLEV